MSYDSKMENIRIREEAKELFRQNKWRVVRLLLGLYLMIFALTFATTLLANAISQPTVTHTVINGRVATVQSNPAGLLSLLTVFVAAPLGMGYCAALLGICRGDGSVGLFSRMGLWLKSIGLYLWVGVKTMLWGLLGAALMVLCVFLGSVSGNEALIAVLSVVGAISMFACMIPAALRYAQAYYVMADVPETGVFESVNISKAMMKGRKWQYVKLGMPYFFKFLGVVMGGALAAGLVAGLLGESAMAMVLMTVAPLALVLMGMWLTLPSVLAYALFYLQHTPAAAAQDETYPQ